MQLLEAVLAFNCSVSKEETYKNVKYEYECSEKEEPALIVKCWSGFDDEIFELTRSL